MVESRSQELVLSDWKQSEIWVTIEACLWRTMSEVPSVNASVYL